jgi:hypothetical protein
MDGSFGEFGLFFLERPPTEKKLGGLEKKLNAKESFKT